MKILKRWHPMQVALLGELVQIEVKALSQREVGAFAVGMDKLAALLQAAAKDEPETAVANLADALGGPFVEDVFSRFVRPGEPMAIDGVEVKSGLDLLREGGFVFVQAVLSEVQRLAMLSGAEGKASPSPSTSPQGGTAALDAGGSPVTSIESVGGPTP